MVLAEMQSHHSEFYDLFDRGGIQVQKKTLHFQ